MGRFISQQTEQAYPYRRGRFCAAEHNTLLRPKRPVAFKMHTTIMNPFLTFLAETSKHHLFCLNAERLNLGVSRSAAGPGACKESLSLKTNDPRRGHDDHLSFLTYLTRSCLSLVMQGVCGTDTDPYSNDQPKHRHKETHVYFWKSAKASKPGHVDPNTDLVTHPHLKARPRATGLGSF